MGNEINDFIWQREVKIEELESDVKRLLDFGNVPHENWNQARIKLMTRNNLQIEVDCLKELQKTILNNLKS